MLLHLFVVINRCENTIAKLERRQRKRPVKEQVSLFIVTFVSSYRPQRSCEGYVFTPVCQSFCSRGGGVCVSACWDTTPRDQAPSETRHPPPSPWQQTATVADGTHLLECILVFCESLTCLVGRGIQERDS